MAQEHRPLAVGDVLHNFSCGVFGRDHYECVRIVRTGDDWIEAENKYGHSVQARGYRSLVLLMKHRDEAKCTGDWNDPMRDDIVCPLEGPGGGVQLTEGGPRYLPDED